MFTNNTFFMQQMEQMTARLNFLEQRLNQLESQRRPLPFSGAGGAFFGNENGYGDLYGKNEVSYSYAQQPLNQMNPWRQPVYRPFYGLGFSAQSSASASNGYQRNAEWIQSQPQSQTGLRDGGFASEAPLSMYSHSSSPANNTVQGAGMHQQERITAVRKNEDGDIMAVQTDGGRVLDYDQALAAAKAGNLAHVDVFHKYGRDILRSEPDGIKENNLDELPQF